MNSTLHGATAEYIEAVRDALADQPADEVAEVIDDITEHLEQVIAEFGGDPAREDLEQRLGTPAAYTAELRAAAGLPVPDPPDGPRGRRRMAVLRFVVTWLLRLGVAFVIAHGLFMLADGSSEVAAVYPYGLMPCAFAVMLWLLAHRHMDSVTALRRLPDYPRLEAGVAALRARRWGSPAVEFVESLRPAWWLLRAWIATQVLLGVVGIEVVFPIDPSVGAIVVLAGAIIGSVWWGRRVVAGTLDGWPRWLSRLGNVVLAAIVPIVVSASTTEPDVYYPQESHVPSFEGFFHPDGTEIINLYVYGADGELIEGAQIYDQDGRPVENVAPWKHHECIEEGGWFPGGPQGNVYPRPGVYYDDQPPRCADPGEAAPFGSALPGSAAAQNVAEAEVEPETNQDSGDPEPGETPLPGGRTPQPDDGLHPTVEPG